MGLVLLVSLSIVAILNIGLGLVVMLGSEKRSLRQVLFFVVSLGVSMWAAGIALFLASNTPEAAAITARVYYLAAAVIGYALLVFSLTFVPGISVRRWAWVLLAPLAIIVVVTLAPGTLVQSVILRPEGNEVVLGAATYAAYSVYFLFYMYGALAVVAARLFNHLVPAEQKQQLRYIFVGLVLAGTFGVLFNLILPMFGNYELIWVGPQFSVLFVGFIFAAVIRHRLFDVRVVIARAVAYLALLISLALLYGLAVFSITTVFFDGHQMSMQQNIVYIILAVFLAFTFQPLKRFFDSVTQRIFFRNEYDPEQVLTELGVVIADEIGLRTIATRAVDILMWPIKPEFIVMSVLPKAGHEHAPKRFSKGAVSKELDKLIDDGLMETLRKSSEKIIVTQEIENDSLLKEQLTAGGVAAVVRLETSHELVGYMLFGDKRSGVPYSSKDIRMLNTVGDELGLAIQNALRFEEIEHFNETLKQQIAEATEQLRENNKKLKELDAVKDEFISMASHQLRTPLTSIKGYLSMVLDGDVGKVPTEQHKLLQEAFMSAQRMVYLVGDFLNVSRIQTGKFVIDAHPTDLTQVVSDEVERLNLTAGRRNIKLDYDRPKKFPLILLDQEKLRQVIMNFIDNAVYYSKSDSTITIELKTAGESMVFRVHDTGIGVPEAERDKIFTKFFRASNARQARPDGTGIGLYLAKKVVAAHGGTVIFESQEGKGSTFGFTLPLDTTPAVAKLTPRS